MLGIIISAAALTPSPIAERDQPAVTQCRQRLAVKAGEIGTFEIARIEHGRGRTTLNGTLTALERPPTAPPGMMTPAHVQAARYAFRCEVRGTHIRSATLKPLSE
ncbi:MAG: hypothetical protein ABR588_00850 [Sphingomicrobium sp.]|nr:hypothetical protein [Sphingomonadales bacterium]